MEINFRSIKWAIVIPGGWLVIVAGVAILLPPESRRFALGTVSMLALIGAWLLLTAVALVVYLYRAWLRLPAVPSKVACAAWLGFQIACTLAVTVTLVGLFAPSYVTSPRQAREWTLQQNLDVMRALINQYTVDKQKRPQSLNDLGEAGYIRRTPLDPMTKRNDTWVLEWSNDPKMPGIVNIRSGSEGMSRREMRIATGKVVLTS